MVPSPAFRGRLWRWTKRIGRLTMLLLIGTATATYLGLPVLARHRAEYALTPSLGGPASMTGMAWSSKDGLILRDLFTVTADRETSIEIESLTLRPCLAKFLRGQLRIRAIVERPQIPGTARPRSSGRCISPASETGASGWSALRSATAR